jgi:hypothetical protein
MKRDRGQSETLEVSETLEGALTGLVEEPDESVAKPSFTPAKAMWWAPGTTKTSQC